MGKTGDIKVGKVTITPAFFTLLSSTKVIRSVEIKSLVLTQNALDKIPVWTKSDDKSPQQSPRVRVESIRLDDALLTLEKASFGPFDARVNLNGKGEPEDASITTQDGKLKAFVKPDKSNYLIDATAKSWKLPGGPAIVFDELIVKGVATLNDADFSQVSAKLYGGTVNGKAVFSWQKGFQLKGNFDVNQVELKSLASLLSPGANISGKLTAKPVFSASAADASHVMSALRLETPFNVQNGVLHGVDIAQAATNLIKHGATGGETHFDQLSGHLNMERSALRFTQLKIASGVLAADGNVNISPTKDLSGRINRPGQSTRHQRQCSAQCRRNSPLAAALSHRREHGRSSGGHRDTGPGAGHFGGRESRRLGRRLVRQEGRKKVKKIGRARSLFLIAKL